jgi:hypothetical protein
MLLERDQLGITVLAQQCLKGFVASRVKLSRLTIRIFCRVRRIDMGTRYKAFRYWFGCRVGAFASE